MKIRTLIAGMVLILAVVGGSLWLWQPQLNAASDESTFEATGVIEVRRVRLAAEIGGQVIEVLVEEGQKVTTGQLLLRLDDALLAAQRAQAQAALEVAQAHLSLLEAGATVGQIEAAEAQLAFAEANLRVAQAHMAVSTAGSRPEEIAAVQTNLNRARAEYLTMKATITSDQVDSVLSALTTAESNLSAANARRESLAADSRNPAFAIVAAEATVADAQAATDVSRQLYEAVRDESHAYSHQIELARLSWEVAQANLAQAQSRFEGLRDDVRTTHDALDAAEASREAAQDQVEASKAAYDALTAGTSAPQLAAAWGEVQRAQSQLAAFGIPGQSAVGTSVEALLAQVDAAVAQRDLAAANLASLEQGAQAAEIDAARAQVKAAQAQLDALDVQLAKLTITAPLDGIVLRRAAQPGETAMPGATLLVIGQLDSLELTVYLPESRLGLVTPGQKVDLRVDAFPDRIFAGTVLRVANEAEYTPTNAQTKEERVRLVYAVVIRLHNPDLALKPGMIADVAFD